jgi:hypothetical protein
MHPPPSPLIPFFTSFQYTKKKAPALTQDVIQMCIYTVDSLTCHEFLTSHFGWSSFNRALVELRLSLIKAYHSLANRASKQKVRDVKRKRNNRDITNNQGAKHNGIGNGDEADVKEEELEEEEEEADNSSNGSGSSGSCGFGFGKGGDGGGVDGSGGAGSFITYKDATSSMSLKYLEFNKEVLSKPPYTAISTMGYHPQSLRKGKQSWISSLQLTCPIVVIRKNLNNNGGGCCGAETYVIRRDEKYLNFGDENSEQVLGGDGGNSSLDDMNDLRLNEEKMLIKAAVDRLYLVHYQEMSSMSSLSSSSGGSHSNSTPTFTSNLDMYYLHQQQQQPHQQLQLLHRQHDGNVQYNPNSISIAKPTSDCQA